MKQIIAILITVFGTFLLSSCSPTPTDEVDGMPAEKIHITPTNEQFTENTAQSTIKVTQSPTIPTKNSEFVVFDLVNANTILPEGVLEEIMYYGAGGGRGPVGLHYCQNESEPTITLGLSQITDMELSTLGLEPLYIICGWQENEQVKITVIGSDGKRQIENEKSFPDFWVGNEPNSGFYVEVLSGIFDFVPGEYQIHVEGQSGNVFTNLKVVDSKSKQVNYETEGKIALSGFEPNDLVSIIYYPKGKPPVWQSFQIGESGNLLVEYEPEADRKDRGFYAIFSRNSGYITTVPRNQRTTSPVECGKALPTRLDSRYSEWLYLAPFLKGEGLNLYAKPVSKESGSQIFPYDSPNGPYVRVLSGPVCGENSTWWKIQTASNQVGWAMESDEHSYYFLGSSLSSTTNLGSSKCSTNLVPGQAVRVTFTDGAPMNVRQAPNLSADILNKIPEGTRLFIRDGPSCEDSHTWWYVETEGGDLGWAVEGLDQTLYLEAWK
jgi:hypothetical protein